MFLEYKHTLKVGLGISRSCDFYWFLFVLFWGEGLLSLPLSFTTFSSVKLNVVLIFSPEKSPASALPLWSWDAHLIWSRVRLCTTELKYPSLCCRPETESRRMFQQLRDEGKSAVADISETSAHLALEYDAALRCHLVTQVLDKVRTWNMRGGYIAINLTQLFNWSINIHNPPLIFSLSEKYRLLCFSTACCDFLTGKEHLRP